MKDIYIEDKLSRFVVKEGRNQLGLIEIIDTTQLRVVKKCKSVVSASTWISKQQKVIDYLSKKLELTEEQRQNISFSELRDQLEKHTQEVAPK